MFKRRKRLKALEEYKRLVECIIDMCESLWSNADDLQGVHVGELDHVNVVKGIMMSLDALITTYANNPFGLPSTSIGLTKAFNVVRDKFRPVVQLEIQIAEIDIKLKNCKFEMIREPNSQFEILPLQRNLEMHLGDNIAAIGLRLSQFKFAVRELQNNLVHEYALINAGIDIIDERNRLKNMTKDGITYSIDFKLIPKSEQLNINKSKEVPSNETKRGKSQG